MTDPQQPYRRPPEGRDVPGQDPYGRPPTYAPPVPAPPAGAPAGDPRVAPAHGVGLGQALRRFYSRYALFRGRASRSEYWWVQLALGFVLVVLLVLLETVGTVPGSTTPANPSGEPTTAGVAIALLLLPFVLAHAVPSMALAVRRLHDANLSGWFYLLSLIPFVGGLVILVLTLLPSKPEGARFDR